MKLRALALLVCLFVATSAAAEHKSFRIAHVRYKDQNYVFVKVAPTFFSGDLAAEERGYTDLKACAREAQLDGHVFAVAVVNKRFKFYGPKNYHDVVRYLDMEWVNARVNGDLNCEF